MKKRILSVLLAVAICFSMANLTVFADDAELAVKDKAALQGYFDSFKGFVDGTAKNEDGYFLRDYGNSSIGPFNRAYEFAKTTLERSASGEKEYTAAYFVLKAAENGLVIYTKAQLEQLVKDTEALYNTNNLRGTEGDLRFLDENRGYWGLNWHWYNSAITWGEFQDAWENAKYSITDNTNIITDLYIDLAKKQNPTSLISVTRADFNALMARAATLKLQRTNFTDERRGKIQLGSSNPEYIPSATGPTAFTGCPGGFIYTGTSATSTYKKLAWGDLWSGNVYQTTSSSARGWGNYQEFMGYEAAMAVAQLAADEFATKTESVTTNRDIVFAYLSLNATIAVIQSFNGDGTDTASDATFRNLLAEHHDKLVLMDNANKTSLPAWVATFNTALGVVNTNATALMTAVGNINTAYTALLGQAAATNAYFAALKAVLDHDGLSSINPKLQALLAASRNDPTATYRQADWALNTIQTYLNVETPGSGNGYTWASLGAPVEDKNTLTDTVAEIVAWSASTDYKPSASAQTEAGLLEGLILSGFAIATKDVATAYTGVTLSGMTQKVAYLELLISSGFSAFDGSTTLAQADIATYLASNTYNSTGPAFDAGTTLMTDYGTAATTFNSHLTGTDVTAVVSANGATFTTATTALAAVENFTTNTTVAAMIATTRTLIDDFRTKAAADISAAGFATSDDAKKNPVVGKGALGALYAKVKADVIANADGDANAAAFKWQNLTGADGKGTIPSVAITLVFEQSTGRYITAVASNKATNLNDILDGVKSGWSMQTPDGGRLKFARAAFPANREADLTQYVYITNTDVKPIIDAVGTEDYIMWDADLVALMGDVITYTQPAGDTTDSNSDGKFTLSEIWGYGQWRASGKLAAVLDATKDMAGFDYYYYDLSIPDDKVINLTPLQKEAQLFRVLKYALEDLSYSGSSAGRKTLRELLDLIEEARTYVERDLPSLFSLEQSALVSERASAIRASLVSYDANQIKLLEHEHAYFDAYEALAAKLKTLKEKMDLYPYSVEESLELIYEAAQYMDANDEDLEKEITDLANVIINNDDHFNSRNELAMNSRLKSNSPNDAAKYEALAAALKELTDPELLGDVDGDGKVTATDALWILQYVVGSREFDEDQEAAADVNEDGEINATDALWVLQLVVGTRESLGKAD